MATLPDAAYIAGDIREETLSFPGTKITCPQTR
jgi:hypothetical protein